MANADNETTRLDAAARAGWLYYIAGNTQDEIARKLNVSRATAQRLVSLCLSQRLITFRLEHPIASCMDVAAQLQERFNLRFCEVAPSDPGDSGTLVGIAERAAALLEITLRSETPSIIGLGTGRAMRATVERIPALQTRNHVLVSLVGNISPDGSAGPFDAIAKLADLTGAQSYPMPLPVILPTPEECQSLLEIHAVKRIRTIAQNATLRLVGIGQLDQTAPLHVDGFVSRTELLELIRLGAVGEVVGWAFDGNGKVIEGGSNLRLTSVPHSSPCTGLTIGVAAGSAKVAPIKAALKGGIINGLITDESTARAILAG
ncbi:sugar-binding transcriptional regulator [Pseudoxanthomonas daejeonensis]|uniref:sugar-binding transcriptional regulator n=1 Tax=Pseudoxanthomonas daejeonensis TaxID=266062 RepID=UPI001F542B19|nr:sugar-binding transcriptional regulator [Pseudoxanthomonas daejeonensis]UNK58636.1 sugar-binding transcriptional regulator [Pseudoxanthomonas daejeonensis]